jgi:hypothetical protein
MAQNPRAFGRRPGTTGILLVAVGDKVAFQSNFGGSFGIYVVEFGTGQ